MKAEALTFVFSLGMLCAASIAAQQRDDEFVGPFANWANLKRDYGAIGDGKADDTGALQKALDDLKDEKKPCSIFIPAGTYRITHGLQMISHFGASVIGEDPATTIIKWDGPVNGTMLFCNGARYGRFGRLTWDGSGKAETAVAHQWDGHTPNANTHNEHADEMFRDVGYGIRAGRPHFMDAECSVLRCRFIRCSKAGISIESFNADDWFIWYSVFEDCKVGVTNDPGAGHFHVYESLFRRSTETDMKMNNCSYFGIRHNTSIGSRAFFIGGDKGCAGMMTLQGNRIIHPTGVTPIQVRDTGPCLLIDNVVETTGDDSNPAVFIMEPRTSLSVGNTFTNRDPIRTPNGKVLSIDDKVVPRESIDTREPDLPPFLPNRHRKTFEIAPGAGVGAIQRAIDTAAGEPNAIVHLQTGEYKIDKPLIIPANTRLQVAGDGYKTRLKWAGTGHEPMLRLPGPSAAVVRDMEINGNAIADGIVAERCDQPGGRIFMEQGEVSGARADGLLVDGLRNTVVELHDFYHTGCKGVAVKAIGQGASPRTQIAIFGGASSGNERSYDVVNGGGVVAEDIWYEGAPPHFIQFTNDSSGSFTLNGATTATGRPGPNMSAVDPNFAALEVDGFRGDVTLLNVNIGTNLTVSGDGPATNFFGMLHGHENYFTNKSAKARALLFGSTKYTSGGYAAPIANQGDVDREFILKMLAPVRAARPRPVEGAPAGATDLRIYRVNVSNCRVGITLR